MFVTNKITVSKRDENRTLTEVYKDIDAQIYKKMIKSSWSISENTLTEVLMVLIDSQYLDIQTWYEISYTDKFWESRIVKVAWKEFIDALHFKQIIEIKCDIT